MVRTLLRILLTYVVINVREPAKVWGMYPMAFSYLPVYKSCHHIQRWYSLAGICQRLVIH